MVITKTPFRMSFFGGGTDMEFWFKQYGGAVLSTTFNHYCYVIARRLPPFFNYSTELAYQRIERVNDVEEIRHPAIRNAMKMLDMRHVRLTYDADLPARAGLGSSSSFAVGMLYAFHALRGESVDKKALADEAIYLERELCGETGGWQDQIAAAFGGLNRIDFDAQGYRVSPISITPERKRDLQNRLLLFFTGFTRFSSEIHAANGLNQRGKERFLQSMYDLVGRAETVLRDSHTNLDEFGVLLDQTWRLKRQTGSTVSTPVIDKAYERGIAAGAFGGKLLGAGGGGFLLFYVRPEHRDAVRQAMEGFLPIPFAFEEAGSRILYHDAIPHVEM